MMGPRVDSLAGGVNPVFVEPGRTGPVLASAEKAVNLGTLSEA
ncbi:MAG: hypothetical protein WD342_17160 [Verrucomicrobiales bacterium]